MPATPPHIQHFIESLDTAVGGVSGRRMFGGWGFFKDGLMFALAAEGSLYLKVDHENREAFEELDLEPFTYERKGKPASLGYYECPESALDRPARMKPWAESAFGAALRKRDSAKAKKKKSRKS